MTLNYVEIEKIQKLSSPERIAGYLFYSAKLAVCGSRIRKDDRPDESWTLEETEEWDSICDELEPWWYAISEEEHIALGSIKVFMAKLTCGESVLEDDSSRNYQVNKNV